MGRDNLPADPPKSYALFVQQMPTEIFCPEWLRTVFTGLSSTGSHTESGRVPVESPSVGAGGRNLRWTAATAGALKRQPELSKTESRSVQQRAINTALHRQGTQQQRPDSPTVTLTWYASKPKVHKPHQRYRETGFPGNPDDCTNARYVHLSTE